MVLSSVCGGELWPSAECPGLGRGRDFFLLLSLFSFGFKDSMCSYWYSLLIPAGGTEEKGWSWLREVLILNSVTIPQLSTHPEPQGVCSAALLYDVRLYRGISEKLRKLWKLSIPAAYSKGENNNNHQKKSKGLTSKLCHVSLVETDSENLSSLRMLELKTILRLRCSNDTVLIFSESE